MQANLNLLNELRAMAQRVQPGQLRKLFHKPVIILSAPRSGSTLLFEQLINSTSFWSIRDESHFLFSAFEHLGAENAEMDSGSLTAKHADPETRHLLRSGFLLYLKNRLGQQYVNLPMESRAAPVRLLEKTPRNALNIPFLLKVFPDAKFIFLYREPRQNIASIAEAWHAGLESGHFVTFRDLPGWDRDAWCLLLPPGWRKLKGKSVVEIAAFQWASCNRIIMNELSALPRSRWSSMAYQDLVDTPRETLEKLCAFSGVRMESAIPENKGELQLSSTTLTPPRPDKWKKYEGELSPLFGEIDGMYTEIKGFD